MNTKEVKREQKRLFEILEKAEVSAQTRTALVPVVENLAWMKVKLDETRAEMQESSVICHYSNGGGQEGERENPIFRAYINLWRAYMLGFEKYTSYLPKEMQDELSESSLTVLEQVLNMKKGSA